MDAIVLSAGKGTRLHPITKTIPKPLFPIAGRHLLCHILDALENSVDRVIIVIGYKADQIKQAIEAINYPFEISWVIQHEQLGTGHALQICRDHIKSSQFFMMYGDIFTNPQSIQSIINQSRKINEKDGLFAAKEVDEPEKYGGLEIENDLLIRIKEKDPNPPSNFINSGIMILPSSIFDSLATTPKSIRGEIEITDSINKLISEGVQFHIHYIKDYWIDTGHPWDLVTANELGMENLKSKRKITPPEGVTIEGPVSIADSTILRPGTFIQGPVVIKDNVTVGPNCYIRPGTYLGENVRIGN
ncbi:MAG: bifunctional sugar-1-phosphate nucleotidylyltransferase/acetyltransferase, partial [Candidatus Hodarchaeales archaeon]